MKVTGKDDLEKIEEELVKCMKCGNCMAVCPVYLTEKEEAGVARGKIALAEAIRSGQLDLEDEDVEQKLFNCLICTSCVQNCPCNVDFGKIILALRAAIVKEKGLHLIKRMIFGALKKQKLFDAALRAGATFQWLGLRKIPGKEAYEPRFPVGLSLKRIFPGLAPTPFRDLVPEIIKPDKAKTRAAFFTGCAFNYVLPQVGHDVIEVLKENQVEVVIPKEQQCCGIAVSAHGDVESARYLARKNLDAFESSGAEYVITACGSCGESWQHGFKALLSEDAVYNAKAAYWTSRTYDLSTFLVKILGYRHPLGVVKAIVTYHDPCHLKKVMKVSAEPREILTSIPGVTLKEMTGADACCGSGGSYTITHYETSMGIAGRKMASINKTGADVVSTGCPGCMMQIFEGISKSGKEKETCHYVSLLAKSYRREREGSAQRG